MKAQTDYNYKAFEEQEEAHRKTNAYKWRDHTVQEFLGLLKEDPEAVEVCEALGRRLQEQCDKVASYIEDVPRGMSIKNEALREVFYQIAEAVRDIPSSPHTAAQRACVAKMDAARIPDLNAETRRAGYEEGYRDAQEKATKFAGHIDIDID